MGLFTRFTRWLSRGNMALAVLGLVGLAGQAEAPVFIRNRSHDSYWVSCAATPESLVVTQMQGNGLVKPPILFERMSRVGFSVPAKGLVRMETADFKVDYFNVFEIRKENDHGPAATFSYQVVLNRHFPPSKTMFKKIKWVTPWPGAGKIKPDSGSTVLIIAREAQVANSADAGAVGGRARTGPPALPRRP